MTNTTKTPETEKKPKEYSADDYLRFVLKSAPLLEDIAGHLDVLHSKFKQAGPNLTGLLGNNYEVENTTKNYARNLEEMAGTAESLRQYNTLIAQIYTHDNKATLEHYLGNVAYALQRAQMFFKEALQDKRLSNVDLIENGAIVNDLVAIEKRLNPVIADGRTMQDVLREYQKSGAARVAQANSGKLPEGLDKVSTTVLKGEKLPKDMELPHILEHAHKVPEVKTQRRAPTLDAEGKMLTGSARYRYLKNKEAERLIAQGEEAEKSRKGEGFAWERRLMEETAKKPEPEIS